MTRKVLDIESSVRIESLPSVLGFNPNNNLTIKDYIHSQRSASEFEHNLGLDVLKISQIVRFARLTSPEPPAVIEMADGSEIPLAEVMNAK